MEDAGGGVGDKHSTRASSVSYRHNFLVYSIQQMVKAVKAPFDG